MKHLVRAGAFALGLLASPASFATEGCRPLEAVLTEVQAVAAAGAKVAMFRDAEAAAAMAAITVAFGDPPDGFKPDLIILLIGDARGVVLFAIGTEVCLQLPMARNKAEALDRAVRGEPA